LVFDTEEVLSLFFLNQQPLLNIDMAEINQPITATPTAVQASNTIQLTVLRDDNGRPFSKVLADGSVDYFFYLSAGQWSRTIAFDGPDAGKLKEVNPHSVSMKDDANGTLLAQCRAWLATGKPIEHCLSKK
jgi:hypothetical protein|tara:strand:+ start:1089 stop:1481 length:393 start_codon:yes stop_codon:yes gene_type:complete